MIFNQKSILVFVLSFKQAYRILLLNIPMYFSLINLLKEWFIIPIF